MHINQTYTNHMIHRYRSIIVYPATEMNGGIIIEIGPGRGDFLFHLAENNPDKTIYGIEIKSLRFDKLIKRRDKRNLKNIKLILADAAAAIPELFPDESVEEIYVNFPDPWPKRRHSKNRLLQAPFLNECARVLKPNGTLLFTTDAEEYAKEVHKKCRTIKNLSHNFTEIPTESDEAYPTYFSEKWKKMGRTIYYQKYSKISNALA